MKRGSPLGRVMWVRSIILLGCVSASGLAIQPHWAFAADTSEQNSADVTDSDPASLVRGMSIALKTLNYEGTFVHVQGVNVTSMKILHASGDYGERERLSSLDGEAREVIRSNDLVTCIWPASKSVVVSKSKPRELLPQVHTDLAGNERYELSSGQPDRVAGKPTHVVNVKPVDKYRYGYRFWIDTNTRMLLRSMLLDSSNTSLEQVMFTHIDYLDTIDSARFEIKPDNEQISWLDLGKAQAASGLPKSIAGQEDRVQFGELPAGYHEVSESYAPLPNNGDPVSHVMLTDGMASVSVYVEYVPVTQQALQSVGLSSMGAINAFGLSTAKAFITAVGEVPSDTVRAVALAVKLRE